MSLRVDPYQLKAGSQYNVELLACWMNPGKEIFSTGIHGLVKDSQIAIGAWTGNQSDNETDLEQYRY